MEDGQCRKKFPKPFRDETAENINGYPAYRRRNNGRAVRIGNLVADNSYVVPYNQQLLCKYRAHINVEACATVKSVKYLFKYVYKGHDCANMEMMVEDGEARDEIKTYLNCRYVCLCPKYVRSFKVNHVHMYIGSGVHTSSTHALLPYCRYVSVPEAMWRLSEYRMHEQSHTVYRLSIHLPEQQRVFFRAGEEAEAVERESIRKTHLTAWFQLNTEDPSARELLYPEIVFKYAVQSLI